MDQEWWRFERAPPRNDSGRPRLAMTPGERAPPRLACNPFHRRAVDESTGEVEPAIPSIDALVVPSEVAQGGEGLSEVVHASPMQIEAALEQVMLADLPSLPVQASSLLAADMACAEEFPSKITWANAGGPMCSPSTFETPTRHSVPGSLMDQSSARGTAFVSASMEPGSVMWPRSGSRSHSPFSRPPSLANSRPPSCPPSRPPSVPPMHLPMAPSFDDGVAAQRRKLQSPRSEKNARGKLIVDTGCIEGQTSEAIDSTTNNSFSICSSKGCATPEKRAEAKCQQNAANQQDDDSHFEHVCPGQHALSRWQTPIAGGRCDVCGVDFCAGATLLGCRQCNYDICFKCCGMEEAAAAPISTVFTGNLTAAALAAAASAVSHPATALRLSECGPAPPWLGCEGSGSAPLHRLRRSMAHQRSLRDRMAEPVVAKVTSPEPQPATAAAFVADLPETSLQSAEATVILAAAVARRLQDRGTQAPKSSVGAAEPVIGACSQHAHSQDSEVPLGQPSPIRLVASQVVSQPLPTPKDCPPVSWPAHRSLSSTPVGENTPLKPLVGMLCGRENPPLSGTPIPAKAAAAAYYGPLGRQTTTIQDVLVHAATGASALPPLSMQPPSVPVPLAEMPGELPRGQVAEMFAWTCLQCTFSNTNTTVKCEMCDSSRSGPDALPPPASVEPSFACIEPSRPSQAWKWTQSSILSSPPVVLGADKDRQVIVASLAMSAANPSGRSASSAGDACSQNSPMRAAAMMLVDGLVQTPKAIEVSQIPPATLWADAADIHSDDGIDVANALDIGREAAQPDQILCRRGKLSLTRKAFACLRPGQLLNDEVINYYFQIIQDHKPGLCWCPNSFFWPKLVDGGHKAVQQWAKRAGLDVFKLTAVFIPLHLNGEHWALALVLPDARQIRYMDSLGQTPPVDLGPRLHAYFDGEHDELGRGELLWDWTVQDLREELPHQQNSFDCGVFMCAYAKHVIEGVPPTFAADAGVSEHMRLKLAASILSGRIGGLDTCRDHSQAGGVVGTESEASAPPPKSSDSDEAEKAPLTSSKPSPASTVSYDSSKTLSGVPTPLVGPTTPPRTPASTLPGSSSEPLPENACTEHPIPVEIASQLAEAGFRGGGDMEVETAAASIEPQAGMAAPSTKDMSHVFDTSVGVIAEQLTAETDAAQAGLVAGAGCCTSSQAAIGLPTSSAPPKAELELQVSTPRILIPCGISQMGEGGMTAADSEVDAEAGATQMEAERIRLQKAMEPVLKDGFADGFTDGYADAYADGYADIVSEMPTTLIEPQSIPKAVEGSETATNPQGRSQTTIDPLADCGRRPAEEIAGDVLGDGAAFVSEVKEAASKDTDSATEGLPHQAGLVCEREAEIVAEPPAATDLGVELMAKERFPCGSAWTMQAEFGTMECDRQREARLPPRAEPRDPWWLWRGIFPPELLIV